MKPKITSTYQINCERCGRPLERQLEEGAPYPVIHCTGEGCGHINPPHRQAAIVRVTTRHPPPEPVLEEILGELAGIRNRLDANGIGRPPGGRPDSIGCFHGVSVFVAAYKEKIMEALRADLSGWSLSKEDLRLVLKFLAHLKGKMIGHAKKSKTPGAARYFTDKLDALGPLIGRVEKAMEAAPE
jgi:hypothetical protein